jgi:hypothetical protein
LETCVKNCGLRFHVKIAQKEFLNDLLRVIQPKNNPPTIVKERVLGLIQYWADAFRGRPQLVTVGEVYEDLRSQGVEFPPMDLDQLAPVETPSRQGQAAPEQQLSLSQPRTSGQPAPRGQRSRRGPIGPLKPEQVMTSLVPVHSVSCHVVYALCHWRVDTQPSPLINQLLVRQPNGTYT